VPLLALVPPPLELFMFMAGLLELFPFPLLLFMVPPPMFPLLVVPPPMLLEFVLIGVEVLIGVDVVFMVVLDVVFVVVPALFVLSLLQPMPKAATASKVRRAKVLRIELSPVTQRVRSLRS
jgi:hypothetical protein